MNKNTEVLPFSLDLAIELLESEAQNAHPVDFECAWQWIGYSSKQAAKKKLVRNFEKDRDYLSKWMSVAHINTSGASQTEVIHLSIDCFKMLGMMAGTERGREIREYFLQCEKLAKAFAAKQQAQQKTLSTKLKCRYIDRMDGSVQEEWYSEASDALTQGKVFEYRSKLDGRVELFNRGVKDIGQTEINTAQPGDSSQITPS